MPQPCPICQARAGCIDSRNRPDGTYRRYKCETGHRYTTVEVFAHDGDRRGRGVAQSEVRTIERRRALEDARDMLSTMIKQLQREGGEK